MELYPDEPAGSRKCSGVSETTGIFGDNMKRKLSTELAYVFGIVFVALGVMLMEKADFGVSMVVAPAYLLYRWLSPSWSFFTFGMNGR